MRLILARRSCPLAQRLRVHTWPARALLAGLLISGLPHPAAAQVTPLSELWREWVILHRLMDDTREEAEQALRAARQRRARRSGQPAPLEEPVAPEVRHE